MDVSMGPVSQCGPGPGQPTTGTVSLVSCERTPEVVTCDTGHSENIATELYISEAGDYTISGMDYFLWKILMFPQLLSHFL